MNDLTKQLLAPDRKPDRYLKQKIESLNKEIAEFQMKNVQYNEDIALSKTIIQEADRLVKARKNVRKDRFANFTPAERSTIQAGLQKLLQGD